MFRRWPVLFSMNSRLLACAMPILNFGSEEQKRQYLPKMCNGEMICSHSITELKTGSDLYGISTSDTKNGKEYNINGKKHYATGGAYADIFYSLCNH